MVSRTIRSLRKTNSIKSGLTREQFAQAVKDVRKRDQRSAEGKKYVWHKKGGRDSRTVPYRFKGDSYRARRFFSQGILKKRIPNHLSEVVARKGKVKVLDVGSAKWEQLKQKTLPSLEALTQ